MLWCSALLAAARNLRQNILHGRIWGNPVSDSEQGQGQEQRQGDAPFASAWYASSSGSLDLPLTGEDADFGSEHRLTLRSHATTNTKGRVRGMVDKRERESTGSRSPTRNSGDSGYNRSNSESDNGSELGEGEVVVMEGDVDVRGTYLPSLAALTVVTWARPSIFVVMAAAASRAHSIIHPMLSASRLRVLSLPGTRCRVPLLPATLTLQIPVPGMRVGVFGG
jgi:hypothetical protein